MTDTETPIRTSICSHAGCPWQLDIYGPEDELVEADHAHQHAMVAPTTHDDGTLTAASDAWLASRGIASVDCHGNYVYDDDEADEDEDPPTQPAPASAPRCPAGGTFACPLKMRGRGSANNRPNDQPTRKQSQMRALETPRIRRNEPRDDKQTYVVVGGRGE